jgi:hypothetical protein
MLNQKSAIITKLESLRHNSISHIVTLNLMGDIIYEHHRSITKEENTNEKITKSIRKIMNATSLLNFDDVKFLMYEEDDQKFILANFAETSIIIGFKKDTSSSDLLDILHQIVEQD